MKNSLPGMTYAAQAATGFGDFSTSTKHILQLPAIASLIIKINIFFFLIYNLSW